MSLREVVGVPNLICAQDSYDNLLRLMDPSE